MIKQAIILSILTTFLISCNSTVNKINSDKQLREQIIGDWEKIVEKENYSSDVPPLPPIFSLPYGMSISLDSIDFCLGFFKTERDSITGDRMVLYLGNIVPYKTNRNSIFIINPLNNKWEFKWKYISRKNDTLKLALNDSTIFKYKKLKYNIDTLSDFDQIIYSSSGCYGSCPIIDISIDKEGNVLFQGEGYVKPLGFISANLNQHTRNSIFDKFRRANPLSLSDEYSVSHTDDQTITTTFIKNGEIVKTIYDYGMAGTSELIWAYIPIANIYSKIQLDTLPIDEPFYPKLHYYAFEKGRLILPLKKSESFYLWTELQKAKFTDKLFKSKYKLTFVRNYTYWGPDPNKERKHKYEISSITTDGQYYKFEFMDANPITYDLGYNFIDRNFQQKEFREPREWEE
ncbi:MAG: hypothetical protein JXC36_08220 [Candidatus Atribacteria bacterium]|nr:hypothetical protein [Candidatus Atribacteria bacterium]